MLKKILIMLSVVCLCLAFLPGCKKSSGPEAEAEYQIETKEEITKENMQTELDEIEKQLEQEAAAEP